MVYSGFWKRLLAYLIDAIVMTVFSFITGTILGNIFASSPEPPAVLLILSFIIVVLINWIYYAAFESSSNQGTLGKVTLGIKVTDLHGNPISFRRATGRYFGKILSSLILCIGYLMVAFTNKKQGLHDKMAGCLVVNE